jgi:hypothetical protein
MKTDKLPTSVINRLSYTGVITKPRLRAFGLSVHSASRVVSRVLRTFEVGAARGGDSAVP